MAVNQYDQQYLSASQQAQLQSLTDQWNALEEQHKAARETGDEAAIASIKQQKSDLNTQAETIRASAGYLSGQSGSDYYEIPTTQKTTTTPSYDFSSAVQDNSSYLQDMYAAQKASALSSINAAYEKNLAALDRAETGLAESYQDARNQTVGASELAKRNFAEYAAAYGLNSGTGGQAELTRNVTLQNNLNSINTQEAQSAADIALQRANAEVEYNDAIVQAEQQGNYELAAALYQEKVRVQEALLSAQIQQAQMEYQAYRDSVGDTQWQASFDNTVAQQDFSNYYTMLQYYNALAQQNYSNLTNQSAQTQSDLATNGWALLKAGVMPTDAMLAAIGIDSSTAQAYIAAAKSSSNSSGSGSSGGSMTLTTAKQAASNGAFDDEVISTLKSNGYTDNMLELIYGYSPTQTAAQSAAYSSVLTGATNLYNNGYSGDAIANYLEGRVTAGVITEAEAEAIAAKIVGG